MTAIYRIPLEVLVEAAGPEDAKQTLEDILSALEASELWYATDAGAAVLDDAATREFHRRGLTAQRGLEDQPGYGVVG
jgi:hypothetical protein